MNTEYFHTFDFHTSGLWILIESYCSIFLPWYSKNNFCNTLLCGITYCESAFFKLMSLTTIYQPIFALVKEGEKIRGWVRKQCFVLVQLINDCLGLIFFYQIINYLIVLHLLPHTSTNVLHHTYLFNFQPEKHITNPECDHKLKVGCLHTV